MLKNSKIKIVSIVPRLQARLVSVMPSYSMPKLVSVRANSAGHGIKPTFTRVSTAYKSDGSVVNAGVPRIEAGKGTLVEEGTVNLLTTQQNFITSWGKYGFTTVNVSEADENGYHTITFTGVSGATVYRVVLASVLSTTITKGSVDAYLVSGTCYVCNANQSIPLTTKKRYSIDTTYSGGGAYFGFSGFTEGTVIKAKLPQIEAKPYATTFHTSTRTAESLTVPASALSASEGTIEFDVVRTTDWKNYGHIFAIGSPMYVEYVQAGTIKLAVMGSTRIISPANLFGKNVKTRISVLWNNSTKVCKLTIGGVIYSATYSTNFAYSLPYLFLGSSDNGGHITNFYFSNLRISSKSRSDAELANVGTLTIDEYTTYFAPLTTDLKAYTKGNGNATLKSISC